mgnify:CR=1 FL=1
MRIFVNLLRALSILAIGGLIGYYDFQTAGWIGLFTNITYFILGLLLVTTWKSPERKQSEPSLDALSLNEQDTDVNAVECMGMIDKPESSSELMSRE